MVEKNTHVLIYGLRGYFVPGKKWTLQTRENSD